MIPIAGASFINKATLQMVQKRLAVVEEACEKALQDGKYGVLVVSTGLGQWTIGPHPRVPYGHIQEFPYGMNDQTKKEYGL